MTRGSVARAIASLRSRVEPKLTLPGLEPVFTPLPGAPFGVAVSVDGLHAFVSLPGRDGSAIAALAAGTQWHLVRSVPVARPAMPRGLARDHLGRYLIVAAASELLVVDMQEMLTGEQDPIAARVPTSGGESVQVALTTDDRIAFVTDEENATLSVFDFAGSLATPAPAAVLVGQVPVPPGPVGCALSADGRHVFVTSQMSEGGGRPGVLSVIGVAEALRDPDGAVVARASAGECPVRVAVSPSGDAVWVTDRGGDSLLAFAAEALVAGNADGPQSIVRVGRAPVGLALVRGGSLVVVANSNRYQGGDRPQTLSVVEAGAALAGEKKALLGTIPAGVFPRELAVLPDDETILVTNFASKSLETVSLAPVRPLGNSLLEPPSSP